MRRILGIALLMAATSAVFLLGTGAGGGGDYKVRAVFDNAVSVIQGEDVKVAGVVVGSIDDVEVTADNKAAVILKIDDPGFQDFRRDAECTIRPQSLIGEKFVECSLTQPRPQNAQLPPKLEQIQRGSAKGQYLLPVANTSTPVDIDLLNNVMRLPERQRLRIILNEFGTAVAGNGQDLKGAIRRANPALRETDKVLDILASQNRVLADLAKNSDTVMQPLSRERAQVSRFIDKAGSVAQATAERRAALEDNLRTLPKFLAELTPTARQLQSFADQAGPVFSDLRPIAPDVSRMIEALGPFSKAGIPALESLGDAAQVGTPAMKALTPIAQNLQDFSKVSAPVASNLAKLTTSLADTGGIERAMDYLFYQVAAINGFDSFGHYLRAGLLVNLCVNYATQPTSGCSSNFAGAAASRNAPPATAASLKKLFANDTTEARTAAPDGVKAETNDKGKINLPDSLLPGDPSKKAAPGQTPQAQPNVTETPSGQQGAQADPSTGLLDYLFGGG
jgi:phospholipid/cholesterol/gamma-HCH transport system substrate-binding protein